MKTSTTKKQKRITVMHWLYVGETVSGCTAGQKYHLYVYVLRWKSLGIRLCFYCQIKKLISITTGGIWNWQGERPVWNYYLTNPEILSSKRGIVVMDFTWEWSKMEKVRISPQGSMQYGLYFFKEKMYSIFPHPRTMFQLIGEIAFKKLHNFLPSLVRHLLCSLHNGC